MLLRRKTRSRIQTAEKALRKGDLKTAISAFEETVRKNPDDVKSRRQLADVYCKAGRFEDAVSELQALAGSYAANGLLLKAISACKSILDIDPDHTQTQATLAKLYAKKRGGGLSGHKTTLPSAMSRGVSHTATDVDIVESEDVGVAIDDDAILESEDVADVEDLGVEVVEVTDASELVEEADGDGAPESAPPPTPPDEDDEEEESISLDDDALEVVADSAADRASAGSDDAEEESDFSLDGEALEEALADEARVEDIAHQLADMEDEDLDAAEVENAVNALGGDGGDEEDAEISLDLDGDDLIVGETDDEIELDSDELPEFALFSELPLHAFEELVSRLELWRVPPGAVIVSRGEVGHSFFVIVSGTARVERDGETLATLGAGEFFGEMAILSRNPRTASVIADEDCELFEIKRDLLDEIASRYKSVERVLMKFCRERLLRDVVRSSLFRGLEEEHVRAMIGSFKTKRVSMGQQVVEQGKKSRGLYVILAGEVDVSREHEGAHESVSQLKEGDVFGEMSLLGNKPATATVTALKNTTLLALSRQGFAGFCTKHPTMKERLEELSAQRMAENNSVGGRTDSRMV